MKTTNYIVQIPEPCHEDWDKMLPDAKGKYCQSCCKAVIDFSNKTDTEIKDILLHYKDQKVCGHFRQSQLDRPLELRIDFNRLPENMSVTKRFTLALLLVFGSLLFNCTDLKGQKVGKIRIERTEEVTYEKGKVKCSPVEEKTTGDTVLLPPQDLIMGDVLIAEDPISVDTPEVIVTGQLPVFDETITMVAGGIRLVEVDTTEKISIPDSLMIDTLFEDGAEMGEVFFIEEPGEEPQDSIAQEDTLKNSDKLMVLETGNSELEPQILQPDPELSLYPNPARDEVFISYQLVKRTDVRIELRDSKGSLIRTLVDVPAQYEGKYKIPVAVYDLSSGIYYVEMLHSGKRYTEKLVVGE